MHKPNTLKTQTEELHWAGLEVAVSLSCINREATSLWGTGETQSHVSLCVPSCDPSPGRQGHNGIIFSCLRTYKALRCFFLPLPFSLQMLQVSSEISFPYFLCSSSMGARHPESEPLRNAGHFSAGPGGSGRVWVSTPARPRAGPEPTVCCAVNAPFNQVLPAVSGLLVSLSPEFALE